MDSFLQLLPSVTFKIIAHHFNIATDAWESLMLMYGICLHSSLSPLNTLGVTYGVCTIHPPCISYVTQ